MNIIYAVIPLFGAAIFALIFGLYLKSHSSQAK